MLSEAPRRCPAAILGAAGAMLGVAGGAAPPCWVWRAGWGGGTAANGGHRARPQQAGGSGGLRALQRRDPTGLSRHCTAWQGGAGGEAVGHRGEPPGAPMQRPQPRCCPPPWGAPTRLGCGGRNQKCQHRKCQHHKHTHTAGGVKRGAGLQTPPCACSPSSPRAGHPPPAAPHGPGPAGRRWKRWGRALLLAITAAVPCAVPAPPVPPSLQALGPLLVSPAAAPGPRGGRQRLPAGTHPAPAWLPGGAVRHPCCSPMPRGLVCGEPVSRKRPNPHPWQPGARGPPTALPSVPWGGRSARRARTGSSGANVHGRARAMPAAQPFVWVPSGTRQLLRGSCKSET